MKCVARASKLRCAFCHDELGSPSWSCERCATRLHEDCRELAGLCPIPGCQPRTPLSIRAVVRPRGASGEHLGAWLATLAVVWAVLARVAPRILRIFEKKKMFLRVPAQVVDNLAHFAQSGPGIAMALLIVVVSTLVFTRLGERPATRLAFVALTAIGLVFLFFVLWSVVLPLAPNMSRV